MNQHSVSKIAVITLGLVMIIFGIYHFVKPDDLIVFVPEFLPGGKIWIFIVGTAFILAGTAFIAHRQVKLAGYLLAFLLLIFIVTIHIPNFVNAGDRDMKQIAFVSVLKDLAICAFALYIASNAKYFDKA